MLSFILIILNLITAWKVFEKYGLPGWHGIVPFLSEYEEYGMVWSAPVGLLYIAAGIAAGCADHFHSSLMFSIFAIFYIAINVIFALKKSKAFGGKMGLTLLLIFLPFIGNLYIGFSDNVQYIGAQTE